MIRPSSLSIAKFCDLAPVLSERYPTRNANTDRGSLVDGEVTEWVKAGTEPTDPDAIACVEWLKMELAGWPRPMAQGRVELRDEDGALITGGTPDIVAQADGMTIVVDLKKREQYFAGRLPEPDDNDQLHAYALASVPPSGSYRTCLLLFGNGKVEALWSRTYTAETWAPILERITAVNVRTGEPRGQSGDHCGGCYPRLHCPHWALRGHKGIANSMLPSEASAADLLLETLAMEERAKMNRAILKDLVDANGPLRVGPRQYARVEMPGRVGLDAAAIEAAGLTERFSKVGRPFYQYKLTRAAADDPIDPPR